MNIRSKVQLPQRLQPEIQQLCNAKENGASFMHIKNCQIGHLLIQLRPAVIIRLIVHDSGLIVGNILAYSSLSSILIGFLQIIDIESVYVQRILDTKTCKNKHH